MAHSRAAAATPTYVRRARYKSGGAAPRFGGGMALAGEPPYYWKIMRNCLGKEVLRWPDFCEWLG
jgi:hypothetical protein